MKPAVDWSLYLVTDRPLLGGRSLEGVVEAAVRGGVTVVQLREKDCSTRDYLDLGWHLKKLLEPFGVPLIIDDRVDVALVVGASGVHIGQSDMPYHEARRLLGPDAIVGLTVDTFDDAFEAATWDVDYLGISPVFETPTKTDTGPAWGLEGVKRLRRASQHVLIGIGGINAANAGGVIRAGADGVAVVSALCAAPDPREAARELAAAVAEARRGRS
jgi:thiamine-phosphate pyrophosphorylase